MSFIFKIKNDFLLNKNYLNNKMKIYIQKLITDYFNKKVENDEIIWRCLICGVDMGSMNPRQFCRKTYCPNQFI
jgi:hypothetical protein